MEVLSPGPLAALPAWSTWSDRRPPSGSIPKYPSGLHHDVCPTAGASSRVLWARLDPFERVISLDVRLLYSSSRYGKFSSSHFAISSEPKPAGDCGRFAPACAARRATNPELWLLVVWLLAGAAGRGGSIGSPVHNCTLKFEGRQSVSDIPARNSRARRGTPRLGRP